MTAPWRNPTDALDAAPAVPPEGGGESITDEAMVAGDVFVLDGGIDLEPRWGTTTDVLWAHGESLMLVAPTGAGKTTVAVQLVEALIGANDGTVLGLPVMPCRHVLYLAMDRPRQIKRALRRRLGHLPRQLLHERLSVRRGPLPTDLAKVPDQLVTLARQVGADVVVVDSLKDACAKLTDDESGSMVNRGIQMANADDLDVIVLHHQRKGQNGAAPSKLEDVYGSTWLTAGAGSVVLLWGEAGSEQVELRHLKQPADPVGPWNLEHDHLTGLTRVVRSFDALEYVRRHPDASVLDVAKAEHGGDVKAGSAPYKRTERRLKRLQRQGLVTSPGQLIVGAEARFRAVDTPRGHGEVTALFPTTVDAP